MKKQELVSFNEVVRDVPLLVELDDAALSQVIGGAHTGNDEANSSAGGADENGPGCNTLC